MLQLIRFVLPLLQLLTQSSTAKPQLACLVVGRLSWCYIIAVAAAVAVADVEIVVVHHVAVTVALTLGSRVAAAATAAAAMRGFVPIMSAREVFNQSELQLSIQI